MAGKGKASKRRPAGLDEDDAAFLISDQDGLFGQLGINSNRIEWRIATTGRAYSVSWAELISYLLDHGREQRRPTTRYRQLRR